MTRIDEEEGNRDPAKRLVDKISAAHVPYFIHAHFITRYLMFDPLGEFDFEMLQEKNIISLGKQLTVIKRENNNSSATFIS